MITRINSYPTTLYQTQRINNQKAQDFNNLQKHSQVSFKSGFGILMRTLTGLSGLGMLICASTYHSFAEAFPELFVAGGFFAVTLFPKYCLKLLNRITP